mgnify:FL=1
MIVSVEKVVVGNDSEPLRLRVARVVVAAVFGLVGLTILGWTFNEVREAAGSCSVTTTVTEQAGKATLDVTKESCRGVTFTDPRFGMPALLGLALLAPLFVHLLPPGSSVTGPGGVGVSTNAEVAEREVNNLQKASSAQLPIYLTAVAPAPMQAPAVARAATEPGSTGGVCV